MGVGICASGQETCLEDGSGYGECLGQVLPDVEDCLTEADEDCDGPLNAACPLSYALDVQPIFMQLCAPCHTQMASGGLNVGNYNSTQGAASTCPGLTRGACTLVRIREGTMPPTGGCTGNPTSDEGNPACLTAAEHDVVERWIAGGQLP